MEKLRFRRFKFEMCLVLGAAFSCLFLLNDVAYSFSVNPLLSGLENNTALDLGKYECNQPQDDPYYCEAITDYSGFTYDSVYHRMLMFGGGHSSTFRDDVDAFDFSTLKWAPLYDSTPCSEMIDANVDEQNGIWKTTGHPWSRHTYDQLVVVPDTREFLMLHPGGGGSTMCEKSSYSYFPAGSVGHFSLDERTWSFGASMSNTWSAYSASEYDPVSGKVILLDSYGLWVYDPVSKASFQAKTQSQIGLSMSYSQNMIYFPANQKMYYVVKDGTVFEVALDRTDFSKSTVVKMEGITGTFPNSPETGWAYDSVNNIIGGGINNGIFYAFDPIGKTWTATQMQNLNNTDIGTVAFHALSYEPIDNVFIFITRNANGRHVWAYKYSGDNVEPPPAPPPATKYSLSDFIILASDWLQVKISAADLNIDGTVNSQDLGIIMNNWE